MSDTTQVAEKQYKFRLLVGTHVNEDHEKFDARDPKRRIVTTNINLNHKGRDLQKFRFISGPQDHFQEAEDLEIVKDSITGVKEEDQGDEFTDMTYSQLRTYVRNNDISLGDARTKDEILAVLRGNAAE